jgi:hypothetical protein
MGPATASRCARSSSSRRSVRFIGWPSTTSSAPARAAVAFSARHLAYEVYKLTWRYSAEMDKEQRKLPRGAEQRSCSAEARQQRKSHGGGAGAAQAARRGEKELAAVPAPYRPSSASSPTTWSAAVSGWPRPSCLAAAIVWAATAAWSARWPSPWSSSTWRLGDALPWRPHLSGTASWPRRCSGSPCGWLVTLVVYLVRDEPWIDSSPRGDRSRTTSGSCSGSSDTSRFLAFRPQAGCTPRSPRP